MDRTVTWGILGTGDIARQMAEDLRLVPRAELRAVASRTPHRAEAFGETHDIPVRYGDYEALAHDPAIDVVYVATPHIRHCEDTLLCLESGKGVLCEKPLAMNRRQVDRMVAAAEESGCFLMEAFWTAFFPAIQSVGTQLAEGAIGVPREVRATFAYPAKPDPTSRIFDPALGGGALLDIGVYTVALADLVFGREARAITSEWRPSSTGVDLAGSVTLDFGEGQRALLDFSLDAPPAQGATITGTEGVIEIPERFSQPDFYTLTQAGVTETHRFARKGYGYHLEAAAVTECMLAGQTQCPTVPWSMSQRVVQTLDRVREQWGLRYAAE